MTRFQKTILAVAGAVWVGGVGAGLVAMWRYEVTPGADTDVPSSWPLSSHLDRNPALFTLVMAAHPHCPCTRASVEGLAHVMAQLKGRVLAYVLVMKPKEFPADWEKADVWRSAERVPGVTVLADVDGAEAALFRAQTSGQTIVYDPSGRLVFNGGLTAARGHAGPSAGQNQVVALVDGSATTPVVGRVFGCALGHEGPPEGRR